MSQNDDRPQDGSRPQDGDGTSQAPEETGSVLGGYSLDDPGAASAPEPSSQTPAAYPPAAPYPPADSSPVPAGSPYEQQQPPYGQQELYGQQQPYGRGYGQSAPYTTTPQPYAYGPPPRSPEAEKVRSSAVLWTILNVVGFFFGNVLSVGGIVLAAVAIGKTRDDVQGARNLVKWSWILFAIGFAFWLLVIVAFVLFVVAGAAGAAGGF